MFKIQGQTVELWDEEVLLTFNKTDMGWLMKCYDLTDRSWPCIATFYVIGKGTWVYDDSKADIGHSSDSRRRVRFGDRVP